MARNIMVVGGAGYIGSHMVLALRDSGYEAHVFDNLSRGFADAVAEAPFICGDLRSPEDLENCFKSRRFDVVMHFAALTYVGESVAEPKLYYENNVAGTLNLLNAMLDHGVKNFVFSSTCATYGEPETIPIPESHHQHPINPYGRTKLVVEQALKDYAHAYGLNSIGLRYFNAAGCDAQGRAGERHDPETHLIPLVLAEALRVKNGGNPSETQLQVFGSDFPTADGSCVRDYIHVTDLCAAHLLAAERLLSGKLQGAEFYNLGNGNGFSVLDVIHTCREVTGQPIQYVQKPRRAGDSAILIGDASAAKNVLNWRPQFADLKGIIETAWRWLQAEQRST